ncbi:hypothetical protein HK105_201491 [Polyrhizophydium stewartii]|uniref:G-protein coupled receptors family 1 profile domain-containing protein n=1 Tax=Polyrhizophydium stewartii TaxID=2732419 RepID=A0ABR4NGM9_9FUNG
MSASTRAADLANLAALVCFDPSLFRTQLTVNLIAIAANVATLSAMARFSRFPETLLSASVLVVDLALSLFLSGVSIASLAQGVPALWTPGMCHPMTLLYEGSQYTTALMLVTIAVLNWLVVAKHYPAVSFRLAICCIAAVWAVAMSIIVATFATMSLQPTPNGIMCFATMGSPISINSPYIEQRSFTAAPSAADARAGSTGHSGAKHANASTGGTTTGAANATDRNPTARSYDSKGDWRKRARFNPLLVVATILLCLTPVVVIWAYASINARVRAIQRSVHSIIVAPAPNGTGSFEDLGQDLPRASPSTETSASTGSALRLGWSCQRRKGKFDSAVRNLALRSFVTTLVFVAFWGAKMATKLVYFFGEANISIQLLTIGHFLYLSTTVLNPLIFLMYDQRLQSGIAELAAPAILRVMADAQSRMSPGFIGRRQQADASAGDACAGSVHSDDAPRSQSAAAAHAVEMA